jgi:hypothetical protein
MNTPHVGRRWLIRAACWLATGALLLMAWSVIEPAALPVVLGMSVGQGLGVLAFGCFALAVLLDVRKPSEPPGTSLRPPKQTPK